MALSVLNMRMVEMLLTGGASAAFETNEQRQADRKENQPRPPAAPDEAKSGDLRPGTEEESSGGMSPETFHKVEQAKREWESTVDSLADLVCLVDSQGRLVRANRTAEVWTLVPVESIKGRWLHSLLHPACAAADCYLERFVQRLAAEVMQGDWIEQETYDAILARHIRISARPIFSDRRRSGVNAAVVVVNDITDQKRAEQERERLIDELEAFAHTVAHDLKNPIGLVVGYADLLEMRADSLTPAELRASAQAISRIARKMNNIIEELLLLAEVHNDHVHAEPLDMAFIVLEAQQRLEEDIRQSQAQITAPRQWPAVLGQAQWVEEVWVNYLSNALKYGGRPPHIELGYAVQLDGMVRFWVRDNGQGIPTEQQSQIFVPFTRLVRSQAKGHGLGLSIIARIIERLGGQVGVESDYLSGQGSTFFFTLPLAPAGD
jgi:signal transduction histidine kinase